MTELAPIETRLPMLGIDDWDEIRKAEATLEAYRKYVPELLKGEIDVIENV